MRRRWETARLPYLRNFGGRKARRAATARYCCGRLYSYSRITAAIGVITTRDVIHTGYRGDQGERRDHGE